MAPVALSLNELTSLARQAAEALLGHTLDFDAVAQQVVWLEARGLDGVAQLLAAAPTLQAGGALPSISEDDGREVDFKGQSWFRLGDLVIDLAIAHARPGLPFRARVIHCRDRVAVIPGLVRCARAGLGASAIWVSAPKGLHHLAWIAAGDAEPVYRTWVTTGRSRDAGGTLQLCCSAGSLSDAVQDDEQNVAATEAREVTAQQFARRFEASLDHGISVAGDAFEQLKGLAGRVLIEASEASRQGAGD